MRALDRWCAALVPLAVLSACDGEGERRGASRAAHEVTFSAWGVPVNVGPPVNSAGNEFAPCLSKDGRTLFFGASRPDDPDRVGGIDVYVSERESADAPWGPPRNLGPAVNSTANDNAPVLSSDGHRIYFASNRAGGQGGFDLYVARRRDARDPLGWSPAVNLGPTINTAANENAPEPFSDDEAGVTTMYFASNRGQGGDDDIYAATMLGDGTFGPAGRVDELSSAGTDQGPDVRRDGLEVVLVSDREGTLGGLDLWIATRASTSDPWSTPVNLGPAVNSTSIDSGSAFSFDGSALYFHSSRPGSESVDLWVATQERAELGPWSEPVHLGPVVNSDVADLSPALSRDTLSLYFASDRSGAGAVGGRDIWVVRRACVGCPWKEPLNVSAVNSAAADSDPDLSPDGHLLFFLSAREGGFGSDDLYVSRRDDTTDDLAWDPPLNLGPRVNGELGEAGPFFLQTSDDGRGNLVFARSPGTGVRGFDLYQTTVTRNGAAIGTPSLIEELNTAGFGKPKAVVRHDGREVFFWSNRPGGISPGTAGKQFDVWTSTRRSVHEPWSPPVVVGIPLDTEWNELTLDLSDDGRTMVFASNRPGGLGGNDLWLSTRVRFGEEGE